jgi:hypothetical protein
VLDAAEGIDDMAAAEKASWRSPSATGRLGCAVEARCIRGVGWARPRIVETLTATYQDFLAELTGHLHAASAVLELSPESGGPVETIVSFGPSPESEAGEDDDRRPG